MDLMEHQWRYNGYGYLSKMFMPDSPMSIPANVFQLDQFISNLNNQVDISNQPMMSGQSTVTQREVVTLSQLWNTQMSNVYEFDNHNAMYRQRFFYKKESNIQEIATIYSAESFYARKTWSNNIEQILIRGFHIDDRTNYASIWKFQIQTLNSNEFAYSMTWYGGQGPGGEYYGMTGGGNKYDHFVIRARFWGTNAAADTNDYKWDYYYVINSNLLAVLQDGAPGEGTSTNTGNNYSTQNKLSNDAVTLPSPFDGLSGLIHASNYITPPDLPLTNALPWDWTTP
jgi:hypothetical protein